MKCDLKYHLKIVFVLDKKWIVDKISTIGTLIDTKPGIGLSLVKVIKLTYKLIDLLLLCQFDWVKPDYVCYTMKYDLKFNLKDILTLDTKWICIGGLVYYQ